MEEYTVLVKYCITPDASPTVIVCLYLTGWFHCGLNLRLSAFDEFRFLGSKLDSDIKYNHLFCLGAHPSVSNHHGETSEDDAAGGNNSIVFVFINFVSHGQEAEEEPS